MSRKLIEQYNILNKQVEYFKTKYNVEPNNLDKVNEKKDETHEDLFFSILKSITKPRNKKVKNYDYKPNVGVFGENSTGKSTFLNALLGNKDEFKMGMSETTDKICVLHNGSINKTNDNFKYRQKDYQYLKYMNIYDVPGFGKYFSESELSKLLTSLDIVFWVVNISSGIKKSDKIFFEEIKKNNNKIIVIFNKIDSLLENSLEENPLEEINIEIEKTYQIFKDNNLDENLIGIIPLSANKLLLNKIKNKNNFYLAYDVILSKLLLYSVFIESYRETYKNININYDFEDWYYRKSRDIIYELKKNLASELKKEISFINSSKSFIPIFGLFINSKDKKAKPIVRKYINSLNYKINNINTNRQIQKVIQENLIILDKFNIFSNKQIIILPNINNVDFDFYINLESLAWDSFWGDSFAEDVADAFETKALKKAKRRAKQIGNICDSSIIDFYEYFYKECDIYAKTLDYKLLFFIKNMSQILLDYMLKDINNTLTENEIKELQNIVNEN